jgi:hypothetical protein
VHAAALLGYWCYACRAAGVACGREGRTGQNAARVGAAAEVRRRRVSYCPGCHTPGYLVLAGVVQVECVVRWAAGMQPISAAIAAAKAECEAAATAFVKQKRSSRTGRLRATSLRANRRGVHYCAA